MTDMTSLQIYDLYKMVRILQDKLNAEELDTLLSILKDTDEVYQLRKVLEIIRKIDLDKGRP